MPLKREALALGEPVDRPRPAGRGGQHAGARATAWCTPTTPTCPAPRPRCASGTTARSRPATILGGGATAASVGAGAVRPRGARRSGCWSAPPSGPPRPSAAGRRHHPATRAVTVGVARPTTGRRATWSSPRSRRRAGRRAGRAVRRRRRWCSRCVYDPWPTPLAASARRPGAGLRARPARAPGRRCSSRCSPGLPAPAGGDARRRRGRAGRAPGRHDDRRGGAACAAVPARSAASLVPWLIRAAARARAPSPTAPEPDAEEAAAAEEPPKEPYAEIAAQPGLGWRSALAAGRRRRRWSAGAVGLDWPLLLPGAAGAGRGRAGGRRLAHPAAARPGWCSRRRGLALLAALVGWAVTRRDRRPGPGGCSAWWSPVGVFWVLWFVYSAGPGLRRRPALRAARPRARLPRLGRAAASASTPASWSSGCPGCCWPSSAADRSLLRTAFPFGPFMLVGALVGVAARALAGRLSRRRRDRVRPARTGRERLAPMLRWLTAGESHGPSLVAILEGLPAHVAGDHRRHRRRAGPPPARLRPRRPDEVRAGRGHDRRRRPARRRPRAARSRSRSATPSGPSGRR